MNDSQLDPPDATLLASMGQQEKDPDGARDAFRVFFERHWEYLYQHLVRSKARLTAISMEPDDVVQEVFDKVWRKGHRTYDQGKRTEGAAASASVRAWLTTIAENVVLNAIRRRPSGLIEFELQVEDVFTEPAGHQRLDHAICVRLFVDNTLTDLNAEIVWFKIQYYDRDTGKSEPDRDELDAFLKRHELTEAAFRQRYSRAINTLTEAAPNTPQLTSR